MTITRREAIQRVSAMLGGLTLVGGSSLVAACEKAERPRAPVQEPIGQFSVGDIAYLDEIADTILPATSTPGAKAAHTGAFMALMVTDTYKPRDQVVFRTGLRTLDEECRKETGVAFMAATPAQRLTLLERIDREQKAYMDERAAARKARNAAAKTPAAKADQPKTPAGKKGDQFLPDQRKASAPGTEAGAAAAATESADEVPPAHYFRMLKELALLGYFTSEIGCKQAMRYVESPGRYDPCVPYQNGERSWAGHA